MKVCIIGGGYVGLITALGLADMGHHSACVENAPDRLASLQRGEAHFFEPGLPELMQRVRSTGRFTVHADLDDALADADVAMIAVGTPSTDKGIDLAAVRAVARDIGARLPGLGRYVVVAVKSTVVPGTTDGAVCEEIERASSMRVGEFGLAMTPEFLREGCAVADFLSPDRIVIGASDDRAGEVMQRLFAGVACPILRTNLRNAEMIKYAANSLLACLISFSNEIARMCERFDGVDEETVMQGLQSDRRIWVAGPNGERLRPDLATYLRAGVGFGGSCFPKDVKALERFAQDLGMRPDLISAIRAVNEGRASEIVDLLELNLGGPVRTRRIAVLGLAFKPDTDDTRESAGLRIADELRRRGATVICHDPIVTEAMLNRAGRSGLIVAPSLAAALAGADGGVIATSWAEYRKADWTGLTRTMARPLILDGRQVIPPEQRGRGFQFASTGMRHAVAPR